MKRFRMILSSWSLGLAATCAVFAASAGGQERPRQFAPGVLTTIPPAPQAEEMFSGPVPLVELPIAIEGLEYDPKLASKSQTVFEKSKGVLLRRTIWNLEFSFKQIRMMYIDVLQATGRMQRQLVWYMVYRIRDLGGHMQPKR